MGLGVAPSATQPPRKKRTVGQGVVQVGQSRGKHSTAKRQKRLITDTISGTGRTERKITHCEGGNGGVRGMLIHPYFLPLSMMRLRWTCGHFVLLPDDNPESLLVPLHSRLQLCPTLQFFQITVREANERMRNETVYLANNTEWL